MKRLKAGEEREGGSSDQWGQMQSMFGRSGGLDTCLVEKEALDFAQGHLGDLLLALAPESQAAPLFCDKSSRCEASFKLYSEGGVPYEACLVASSRGSVGKP